MRPFVEGEVLPSHAYFDENYELKTCFLGLKNRMTHGTICFFNVNQNFSLDIMNCRKLTSISLSIVLMCIYTSVEAQRTIDLMKETPEAKQLDLFSVVNDTAWYQVTQRFQNIRLFPDSAFSDEVLEFPLREVVLAKTDSSTILEWTLFLNEMEVTVLAPERIEKPVAIGPIQITFEYSHHGEFFGIKDGKKLAWPHANLEQLSSQINGKVNNSLEYLIRDFSKLYQRSGQYDNDFIIKQLLHSGYTGFQGHLFQEDEIVYNLAVGSEGFYINFWGVLGARAIKGKAIDSGLKLEEVKNRETRDFIEAYHQNKRIQDSLLNPLKYVQTQNELKAELDSFMTVLQNDLKEVLEAKIESGAIDQSQIDSLEQVVLEVPKQSSAPPIDYFPDKRGLVRHIIVDKESYRPQYIYAEKNIKFPGGSNRDFTNIKSRIITMKRTPPIRF